MITLDNLKTALKKFKSKYTHDHLNSDVLYSFELSIDDLGNKKLTFGDIILLDESAPTTTDDMMLSSTYVDADSIISKVKQISGFEKDVVYLNEHIPALSDIDSLLTFFEATYMHAHKSSITVLSKITYRDGLLLYNDRLIDIIDNTTFITTDYIIDGNITVSTLSKLKSTVDNINNLDGLNDNIVTTINEKINHTYNVVGEVNSIAELNELSGISAGTCYVVLTDESNNNQKTLYMYDSEKWCFVRVYEYTLRDFIEDKLDLSLDVIGVVKLQNIPDTIARKSDLHFHQQSGLLNKEEQFVTNSHIHDNMDSLNGITISGDKIILNGTDITSKIIYVDEAESLPATGNNNALYIVKCDKFNNYRMSIYTYRDKCYNREFTSFSMDNISLGIMNQVEKTDVIAGGSFNINVAQNDKYILPSMNVLRYSKSNVETRTLVDFLKGADVPKFDNTNISTDTSLRIHDTGTISTVKNSNFIEIPLSKLSKYQQIVSRGRTEACWVNIGQVNMSISSNTFYVPNNYYSKMVYANYPKTSGVYYTEIYSYSRYSYYLGYLNLGYIDASNNFTSLTSLSSSYNNKYTPLILNYDDNTITFNGKVFNVNVDNWKLAFRSNYYSYSTQITINDGRSAFRNTMPDNTNVLDPVYTKYLIRKDNNYYNIVNGELNLLQDLDDIDTNYTAIHNNGIDLTIDNTRLLLALNGDTVSLVSLYNTNVDIPISYVLKPQMVTMTEDIDIPNIYETINYLNMSYSSIIYSEIKIAMSFNGGRAWYGVVNGVLTKLTSLSKDELMSKGISITELKSLDGNLFKNILTYKRIRFSFYMAYDNRDLTVYPYISNIQLNALKKAQWHRAIPGVDYNYGFPSNTTVKFDIITAGTYKINYLEYNDYSVSAFATDSTLTTIELSKDNLLMDGVTGMYYYDYVHNKDTYNIIVDVIDVVNKQSVITSFNCIDNNTVRVFLSNLEDVILTILV